MFPGLLIKTATVGLIQQSAVTLLNFTSGEHFGRRFKRGHGKIAKDARKRLRIAEMLQGVNAEKRQCLLCK